MKRLNLLVVAAALLLAVNAFAVSKDAKVMVDYEWAQDPRSLAPTTEGLDEFLAVESQPSMTTAFGQLLGQWSWTTLGIPSSYSGAGIGISWPYVYLANQSYSRMYRLDISSGTPSGATYIFSPTSMPWGCGVDNEPQGWLGHYTGYYDYEFNVPGMGMTGNRFYVYQSAWMGDISDNVPKDSIYQVQVGSLNHIFCFAEPGGATGRNFGHTTWDYISQRALAWNIDDATFIIGGWNSARVWEISYTDGSPIPTRTFAPTMWQVAGCAYQEEARDGTAKLWIQTNSYPDYLQVYHFPKMKADDVSVQSIDYPNFPFIDPTPLTVKATIGNIGTGGQNFDTWVVIDWGVGNWTSPTISTYLASFTTAQYTYAAFANGLPVGTSLRICVYVNNPGDEDVSNDNMCTSAKIFRECYQYTHDLGVVGNAFYFYDYAVVVAKQMGKTGDTKPVTAAWVAVNTISRGDPYYPWPDPVYDPIIIGAWTDDNNNGIPEASSKWEVTVRPSDTPSWCIAEVPECAFLGLGGKIWVGMQNIAPGREGMCVDPTPIKYSDGWYRSGNTWYNSMLYGDYHIRGCLEWPKLVSVTGLDEVHFRPPKPPRNPMYAFASFSMKLCGSISGTLSGSALIRQYQAGDPVEGWEYVIPAQNLLFVPPSFSGSGGQTIDEEMIIVVPIDAPEGVYLGKVYITHMGGVEELPLKFVIDIDPDLDIQDYAGNIEGNVMTLMGVRDGVAVGTFKLMNPNNFELNFDQEDGPANSHLYNGVAEVTDLYFCNGGPNSKEPIPASDVDLTLGSATLYSGEGTFGVVTVNIPFYAKHWTQQYDFGYCGTVTVTYEDRLGNPASDEFDIYLMVLKAHGGMNCGLWGEHEGGANVVHWSDLGLSESGYSVYRNGVKIADVVGGYEYRDPVNTNAAFEYTLGVNVGGSEVMIGPVIIGGSRTPSVFSLSTNYPNPVSDHTSIRYTVAEASNVTIGVYNSAGMLVKNLVNEYRTPGVYTVEWNNVELSNGVYFYRMNAGDFSMTHKMVVMK